METSEKLKENILNRIETSLKGSEYRLIRDESIPDFYNFRINIDGVVKTADDPFYCVINVIPPFRQFDLPFIRARMLKIIKKTNAKLAIFTSGSSFYFYDYIKRDFEKKNYDKVIEKLLYPQKEKHKKAIYDYLNTNFQLSSFKEDDIHFDGNKYTLNPKLENDLINKIFDWENIIGSVYHYTTLDTAFEILKNSTIRLFGIAGMNDTSEINYVEEILYPNIIPDIKTNKTFILSCSIGKNDDLTLWRLYGDDAKGACLRLKSKFKSKSKFQIKSGNMEGFFTLRKVKYIDQYSHEIQQLKDLVSYVKKNTGYILVFNTLHEWCHFIKPKNYEVESEVRLLYQSNDLPEPSKWLITNKTNIINPYVEFDLDKNFPLGLVSITLGPKCQERETNVFQLEELAKSKSSSVYIDESEIKNYR